MEKLQGKYYLRFKNQTWEQALVQSNGFESLLEAVQEALDTKNDYSFLVSDYEEPFYLIPPIMKKSI